MTHPARRAYVESLITQHYTGHDVEVRLIGAADWYLYVDAPQGRYGWVFPVHDGRKTVILCPDVITHQTAEFSDAEFKQYLHAILWMCDEYYSTAYTHNPTGCIDVLAIQQQLESHLYDHSPAMLALLTRVQFSVLDR